MIKCRACSGNQVDFLDTAGDMQFPAMRRLSITNANAFLLVYSISDPNSFTIVKNCFEEIREVRSDFQVHTLTQQIPETHTHAEPCFSFHAILIRKSP
jgi:GTPase SAR1 family protein